MKKNNFMIIIVLIILILGGIYLKQKSDEDTLLKAEQDRIEKYLKYNYLNIQTVILTKAKKMPTGTIHIYGYINNDKEFSFYAPISSEHFKGGINFNKIIPEYKDSNENTKQIPEIEEEEAKETN